ncbi:hypothetical protein [Nocardia altamirensis]|uniref:hypothetical protein n=1 Tax=Nocardia altamirensis TaxID=472158 RepID=UPI000B25D322|nr:hypothetical protein [Nocardia altamirensis]
MSITYETSTPTAGFEPMRPYGPESYAELEARVIAANERAALLAEQLAAMTADRDAAEHRAAELDERNRELASDLDDALDLAQEHALDAERERLAPAPIRGHAFAGLMSSHDRDKGMER